MHSDISMIGNYKPEVEVKREIKVLSLCHSNVHILSITIDIYAYSYLQRSAYKFKGSKIQLILECLQMMQK